MQIDFKKTIERDIVQIANIFHKIIISGKCSTKLLKYALNTQIRIDEEMCLTRLAIGDKETTKLFERLRQESYSQLKPNTEYIIEKLREQRITKEKQCK